MSIIQSVLSNALPIFTNFAYQRGGLLIGDMFHLLTLLPEGIRYSCRQRFQKGGCLWVSWFLMSKVTRRRWTWSVRSYLVNMCWVRSGLLPENPLMCLPYHTSDFVVCRVKKDCVVTVLHCALPNLILDVGNNHLFPVA